MTTNTTAGSIRLADLPSVIRAFLAARSAKDTDAALATFTHDAVVVDQDETFHGTEQVLDFLQNAGGEFTYTTELIAARRDDDAHWGVAIRIAGNFPGNVADLDYQFTVIDDRISGLVIS
jgi:UDP-N-acetylglucosamine enolpyruvyl transferase